MARLFHHRTRRQYGIARPKNTSHCPGPVIAPIHDRSVHLLGSCGGEDGAPAGIEQRVVLERDDCLGYRIERGAASGENVATGRQGAAQALVV
jgi:hypothetical protein